MANLITKKALLQSPFTVDQDAYYPTETAAYAHIVLPAAQWGEKTGTITNSERVVILCPQFRYRPGEARPDWEIFAEVGRRLGFIKEFDFASSEEVYVEYVQLTRDRPGDVSELSHKQLQKEGPIQWPCPVEELPESPLQSDSSRLFSALFPDQEEPSPAKRLYTDGRFHPADGRAKFAAFHSKGLAEPGDE